MTNAQIIIMACVLNGVEEEVDTYAGWARKGRQVQKGQKALFKTSIWKPRKGAKVTAEDEAADDEAKKGKFVLVTGHFFGISQTGVAQ